MFGESVLASVIAEYARVQVKRGHSRIELPMLKPSLASQVDAVEKENQSLKRDQYRLQAEKAELERKIRNLSGGNVVMVNRDGFAKAMTIPEVQDRHSLAFYNREEAFRPYEQISEHDAIACRRIDYRYTGRRDAARRYIFEQI